MTVGRMSEVQDQHSAATIPEPKPEKTLRELISEFSAITDPAERKRFYDANPLLERMYSPVNFHS
jgi:hypothetical protein